MKHSEYSVIVVGSGAAGLYAAIKIASQISLPDGVLLITKSSCSTIPRTIAIYFLVKFFHKSQ